MCWAPWCVSVSHQLGAVPHFQCRASQKYSLIHIASLGNDENSKFKIPVSTKWVLLLHPYNLYLDKSRVIIVDCLNSSICVVISMEITRWHSQDCMGLRFPCSSCILRQGTVLHCWVTQDRNSSRLLFQWSGIQNTQGALPTVCQGIYDVSLVETLSSKVLSL